MRWLCELSRSMPLKSVNLYLVSKFTEYCSDMTYKVYLTSGLRGLVKLDQSWKELNDAIVGYEGAPADNRSAKEIISDTIKSFNFKITD